MRPATAVWGQVVLVFVFGPRLRGVEWVVACPVAAGTFDLTFARSGLGLELAFLLPQTGALLAELMALGL
jgi:hypothetical protein